MIKYIYGVALNGTSSVSCYKVINETKKLYVIDRPIGNTIRKDAMSDRWEWYYTDKNEAEKFLSSLLYRIEKATKHIDVKYLYRELTGMWTAEDISDRLKNLIRYVEEFL